MLSKTHLHPPSARQRQSDWARNGGAGRGAHTTLAPGDGVDDMLSCGLYDGIFAVRPVGMASSRDFWRVSAGSGRGVVRRRA